ncbi:hypothetical protein FAES_5184 [Fibrella aestuarina BUZ 2]|uniref:Uncharacterized protein n=1 Tax=Fibrella aestuarina BUZ 2 TaxID=1166018 RepID=I0KGD0_9BACT|nr:hypothetical protein FAES_5184 [Fibrella aestuarina BUZ 2]
MYGASGLPNMPAFQAIQLVLRTYVGYNDLRKRTVAMQAKHN